VYAFPVQDKAELEKLHRTEYEQLLEKSSALLEGIRESNAPLKSHLIAIKFSLEVDGYLQLESLHETTAFEPNATDPTTSYGQQNTFEVYAFLRDAFHKHKFHSERDDYVLEPYYVESTGDYTWIGKVARSLHRAVISGYRGNDESMCDQALGKLAYLEAFLTTTKLRSHAQYLPALNIETLRSAICAAKQEIADRIKDEGQRKQMLVAFLAIFIPFFFVLLQLLQVPCIDGLNYDYKAASAPTATTLGTAESGNCTKVKFSISQRFLETVGFVLQHLHWVMLLGITLALIASSLIYRKSWLPRIRVKLLTSFPSLYRFAVAEPQKAMEIVAALFLAVFGFGFLCIAELLSFNAFWWPVGRWFVLIDVVLSIIFALKNLSYIYGSDTAKK
jgi:hypothetical protein